MTSIITNGDCIEVMAAMPKSSVDFILTDPPYLVNYRDRSGRRVPNDNDDLWLKPASEQMFSVLKRDAFAVSFYAWNRIDLFMTAWKAAGFRIGGHIPFIKEYASSVRYMQHTHEQAYLLVKGNPAIPAAPIPDVIPWENYTGNRLHPTQKPLSVLRPLIEAFSEPEEIVLDPFCGSGSTLKAAQQLDRRFIGIELDPQHFRTAAGRLFKAKTQ